MKDKTGRFSFDGSAAGYLGIFLFAAVITAVTLGFGFPLALVMVQRWKSRHLTINGRRLVFTGSARELFRDWLAWWLLTVGTLGLYGVRVYPRIVAWTWENTDFDRVWQPEPATSTSYASRPLAPPSRLHLAFFTEAGRHQLVS
jgi:uncharacterized membrane protein YjgN (DUF898 family)